VISLNNITLRFGTRILFEDVSLRVSGKDRVAFVGSNGAGKSTLLKIISGNITPDEGAVVTSRHTTLGYLPQEGIAYEGKTLYDEVYSAAGDINKIQEEIEEIEKEMNEATDTASDDFMDLLNEYSELQERFNLLDGFKLKSKIEKILLGLGFKETDFERQTTEFSGGWQMRIALAKLLLQNPSILLLDEPTNHLDIESLIWVESYLKGYHGAIILVSHDRNFLNNITSRTVEISLGNVTEYSGNYAFYVKEKEERKQLLENRLKNQEKYIKEQEKFIERFRYKASKAKAVQSRIKMLDKLDKVEMEDEESSINFYFPPATHSGKVTLEIDGLTKSYDGISNVLENVGLTIERGEKIAFLGVNGAGKSTLSRIIAGNEPYNKGLVKYGHLVDLKFYSQNQAEELDGEKTVLEIMEEASSGEIRKNLRTILGGFLFRGDDVFKKVKVLSGGEKSRLALAKMLIEPSNFLVLDEPTNHLDMRSKDVLKNALVRYEGTVIVVSHDREFLDGIVSKVIEVKDKGIKVFLGNLSEFLAVKEAQVSRMNSEEKKQAAEKKLNAESKLTESKETVNLNNGKKNTKEIKKQISPVKRKLSQLEADIEQYEIKIKELEAAMQDPEFFKKGEDVKYISSEYNVLKEKLAACTDEWERESEKLTELEKQLVQ
jgi:ATP-binding cassette subfamily F protein 3